MRENGACAFRRAANRGRGGRLRRGRDTQKTIVTDFCCDAAYLWSWVWGGTNRRTEPMSETAFLFATLAALLAAKGFALIAVGKGRFDGVPRQT